MFVCTVYTVAESHCGCRAAFTVKQLASFMFWSFHASCFSQPIYSLSYYHFPLLHFLPLYFIWPQTVPQTTQNTNFYVLLLCFCYVIIHRVFWSGTHVVVKWKGRRSRPHVSDPPRLLKTKKKQPQMILLNLNMCSYLRLLKFSSFCTSVCKYGLLSFSIISWWPRRKLSCRRKREYLMQEQ